MDHQRVTHPKSLKVFFATEMWERYGFYVIQTLLTLYLAAHFKWPDKDIYALVGSFTALTYLCPLVGGWVADHLLGQKKSILLGLIILFMSYCLLSSIDNAFVLTVSLAAIAVGTGLVKPNISSLLGNEYVTTCPRRESGFTIFYMGITTGIILGTTLPSILNNYFGWGMAFTSAALGLIIAFATFAYGASFYKIKDYNPFVFQFKKAALASTLLILLWALSFYILNSPQLANVIFGLVVLFSACYLLYAMRSEKAFQSRKTLILGLLCIISVLFWAFYFQMFLSWTLFISRVVAPTLWGISFPPPFYVTIQSIGMLVIGYFLARNQKQLSLKQRGLSISKKFLLAMFFMTVAYAIIALAGHDASGYSTISPLHIIPAYLMISLAELLLSPVGLSAITLLADKNKVSTMMGIFFVSLGIGGFLAGKIANITAIPTGETNLSVLKTLYATAFTQQVLIVGVATGLCFIIYLLIRYLLLHGPSEE